MSGFVPGGTNDAPTSRDEAWIKAQREVDERRLAKLDAGKQADGKTLYETLQANKAEAAKQEAFEESMKLKNQFRALDDDEVDFLESITAAERAKEAEANRDTVKQLEVFRLLQDEAASSARETPDDSPLETGENWATTSRKRKNKTEVAKGIRKRRMSATITSEPSQTVAKHAPPADSEPTATTSAAPTSHSRDEHNPSDSTPVPIASAPGLGLAAYSSSDED